jgi:hypothetical protein
MRQNINSIWPGVIGVLLDSGYSHNGLARRVGTQQSTISRMYAGKVGDPGYSLGAALIELAGGPGILLEDHGIDVAGYIGRNSGKYEENSPIPSAARSSAAINTVAEQGAANA